MKEGAASGVSKNNKPFSIIKGSLYSKLLKKSTAEDRKKKGFTYKSIAKNALIKGTEISLLRSSSEIEGGQDREDIVNSLRMKKKAGLTLRSWRRRGDDLLVSFRSEQEDEK